MNAKINKNMRRRFVKEVLNPLGNKPYLNDQGIIDTMYAAFIAEEGKKLNLAFRGSPSLQSIAVDRLENTRNNDIISAQYGGSVNNMFQFLENNDLPNESKLYVKALQNVRSKQTKSPISRPSLKTGFTEIDSNYQAVQHYYFGKGSTVNLGPKTRNFIMNSSTIRDAISKIKNGNEKSLPNPLSVNIRDDMFFVGRTPVFFNKSCNGKKCTIKFTSKDDGFWDPIPDELLQGDGFGGNHELGGDSYWFNPFSWSVPY